MDRFNVTLARQHFGVIDGQLVRKMASGHVKAVSTMEGKNLVAVLEGVKHSASDIFWALTYGSWPKYPLAVLGDPHLMSLDNVYPARVRRLRCQLIPSGERYRHPLSGFNTYPTKEAARSNWVIKARAHYQADLAYVLELEAAERLLYAQMHPVEAAAVLAPQAHEVRVKRFRSPNKNGPRPKRTPEPEAVEGKKWYWYKSQWVLANEPVHVSDDWMMRCAAAMDGRLVNRYDAEAGKTLYSKD